jgi:hypothetical protein
MDIVIFSLCFVECTVIFRRLCVTDLEVLTVLFTCFVFAGFVSFKMSHHEYCRYFRYLLYFVECTVIFRQLCVTDLEVLTVY